jgi:AraC-like DNA-binding protein
MFNPLLSGALTGERCVQPESEVSYWEIHDGFQVGHRKSLGRDAVVFSNIAQGTAASAPVPGLCVRMVVRGCENYRIGGRGYRLEAGQIMIAPHDHGSECEIRRVERAGTLGLCSLIGGATDELDWAFGPIVLGAACSPLGSMLHRAAEGLSKGSRPKEALARDLITGIRTELPNLASSLLTQVAAAEGSRLSTRVEMVRRANLAQAYLNSTTDRPIDLEELAGAVGVSPFRLLAAFQHCFGDTPAAYHRKLRLNLALSEARRRRVPVAMIVEQFGFSSASSFSHAYRRAFGHAPVWRKSGD